MFQGGSRSLSRSFPHRVILVVIGPQKIERSLKWEYRHWSLAILLYRGTRPSGEISGTAR